MKIKAELEIKVQLALEVQKELEEMITLANQMDKASVDRLAVNLAFAPISSKIRELNEGAIVSCIKSKGEVVE